ncbi:MAG: response regulator transcription factor [Verrucomicrobiota bacterium]|jgi:two-component system KDP operon response regulator KdpE
MKPYPVALIIDDDRPIRRLLRNLLEADRYRVFEAETAQLGMKEAAGRSPDVIIMEWSLPDMAGLTLLQRLREWNHAPVLILSSRDAGSDKVLALDSGANDYVTKPFCPAELMARLRVLQRPLPAEPDGPIFVHGGLSVDVVARTVTLHGRKVDLTPTEQAIFYTLVRHAGKVVTRKHLFRCVWGTDSESKLHDLHVYIANLRQKLREASGQVLIQTEGGAGYRLLVPSSDSTDDKLVEPNLAVT